MTRLQCRIVHLGTNKVSECHPYLQTSHTTLPELLYKHQIVRTKKHDADKAVGLKVFHTTNKNKKSSFGIGTFLSPN